MRRGWLRPLGWTLATGAIVGLSYYGVQSVLAGPHSGTEVSAAAATPYLPAPAARSASPSVTPRGLLPGGAVPSASASAPASASAAPSPSPASPTAPPVSARPTATAPGTPASPPAATPTGGVRTYEVEGGSVTLDLGASAATLVSRTANPGWSAQSWQENGWLRVDFSNGRRVSAVVCSWNGHPPTVQTYNG